MINKGKAKIETSSDGLEITIPAYRGIGLTIFLLIVIILVGSFLGAFLKLLFKENDPIDYIFLAIGFILLVPYLFLFSWYMFGKEIIVINKEKLIFSKTLFNIGLKERMELKEIKNLRISPFRQFIGFGLTSGSINRKSGKIKFDYGMKTYGFGNSVEEAEANYLINLIKVKLNNL
jgi:hypothetical protein